MVSSKEVTYGQNKQTKTKEHFILKSIEKHGEGVFDYSKVEYRHSKLHVNIGCLVCGHWFFQKPNHNLNGRGCPECSKVVKSLKMKHTHQDFLDKCYLIHGDLYEYDLVVYEGVANKVEIICKTHGSFLQCPAEHFSGAGCPKCFEEIRGQSKRKKSSEDFLGDCSAIHGDKYDYTDTVYNYSNECVKIKCKTCDNTFLQTPSGHKQGYGCPTCAANNRGFQLRSTTESFIEKSKKLHGIGKFFYDKVKYETSSSRIDIGCTSCGNYWSVLATKHLAGHGCSYCADYGFSYSKPATLYVLTCEDITKVGITNRKTLARVKEINKDSGKVFTILKTYDYLSGKLCHEDESTILGYLRGIYRNPVGKYNGVTECFIEVDLDRLFDVIEKEVICGC